MKRLSAWLYRISTGPVALGSLIVFALFIVLVLPGQSAGAAATSGDAGSPDMSFIYTPDDLYRMAEAYGEAGRAAYIRARLTFDVVWPIVYTLFLATTISWSYARAFAPGSRWRSVNLVPLLGAFCDYAENLAAVLVMARYPARTPVLDGLAPVFTLTKWILINGSFVLLLVGIAIAIWQWGARLRKRS